MKSIKKTLRWIGIYLVVLILEILLTTMLSRHIHYPSLSMEIALSIAGLIFPGLVARKKKKKKGESPETK